MLILLFFAFLSGLVTILAPCIWPLLPIILSSSTTGGHKKSLGITLGIMLSFAAFTLSISYLVSLFNFDPDILRLFAVVVIGTLGIAMIIPALIGYLEVWVSRLSGGLSGGLTSQRNGFFGGFITGVSLGLVWSPCAGPILATIATLAATRAVSSDLVLVTLAYVLGVGIPLFIFSYVGGWFFTKSRFVSAYTGRIQQVFGVIMLLTALAIYTNYDKVLQAKLLDVFPSYSTFLNNLESNQEVQKQLDLLKNTKEDMEKEMKESSSNLPYYGTAPEFVGITKWLNTDPLIMQSLKGKVVLIDFWTYTCINCIRTLPHVTSWYGKYKDKGLVVVGVHTPEFEFEKKTENVLQAITRHAISYPVAQDNDFATWRAYNNRYWPAKYLIDKEGRVRYFHFGEGKYEETEKAIVQLLGESMKVSSLPDTTPKNRLTPELYLGSARMEYLYPQRSAALGSHEFELEENVAEDHFSFGGKWMVSEEYSMSIEKARLKLHFKADKVFLVMRSKKAGVTVKVLLDGKAISEDDSGADVENGVVVVSEEREYNLVDLKDGYGIHKLELEFEDGSIEVYAFTFG